MSATRETRSEKSGIPLNRRSRGTSKSQTAFGGIPAAFKGCLSARSFEKGARVGRKLQLSSIIGDETDIPNIELGFRELKGPFRRDRERSRQRVNREFLFRGHGRQQHSETELKTSAQD